MKKYVLIVMAIFFVLLTGCNSGQQDVVSTPALPQLYEDNQVKVAFRYPDKWIKTENFMGTKVMVAAEPEKGFTANMNLFVSTPTPLLDTITQEELATEYENMFVDFKFQSFERDKLSGNNCLVVSYYHTQGHKRLFQKQYILNYNKQQLCFTFTTLAENEQKYRAEFTAIANSIVFK